MISKNALKQTLHLALRRYYSQQTKTAELLNCPAYISLCQNFTKDNLQMAYDLINSMTVYENFLGENEEEQILAEIEPYLNKLRYEFAHWDDAIHGYRETERLKWNDGNKVILERVKALAFPSPGNTLKYVHILDLNKVGYIKPHIDAVRFCGDTIVGLSLLSDSVMRLVNEKKPSLSADVFLKRRSLYIMKGAARYDYTHEILKDEESQFMGQPVPRERRISIICRNEPRKEDRT